MKAINPANGALIREYTDHTVAEVDAMVAKSDRAFRSWRDVPFAERAALMHKAAEVLRANVEKYALIMTDEMGKTIREARAEATKCAWVCEYYADNAERFLAPEPIETDASKSFARFDPIGPVLAVMPWNFPMWQVFRFAAPTLMAGDTGLLKHASNVPGCALAIEEVFREAGFPDGVFQTLLIGSRLVEGVVRDWRVKAVTLTGSEPAGRAVATAAGDEIKPSVLELGGSDPCVVLADADLETAVDGALLGRMINTGQSCIAAKRFIVEAPVYDAFVEGYLAKMAALKVGDPRDESTDVGPLAMPQFVDELHDQVVRSVDGGANLRLGGEKPSGPGFFYPPTLLTEVTQEHAVFREETFGPVAPVTKAEDTDHAIELANDSEFGLGGSIYTTLERGVELARRIETGHVAVNGIVKSDPRLPFGGVKRSGYGRELSRYGILAFVNIKTVWAKR